MHAEEVSEQVPRIDVSPLLTGSDDGSVARSVDRACRRDGFFTIVGHGVSPDLRDRLESCARRFFALDEGEKSRIEMHHGGRSWRGWFPVGGELTSGRADVKEGVYFGADLPADDDRVRRGLPLHGSNLWPSRPAEMRPVVTEWMHEMRCLAAGLLRGIAVGLGLEAGWFENGLTKDPIELFRIFHYPPARRGPPDDPPGSTVPDAPDVAEWGVGEHTDYGLLTILAQDDVGGLQVHTSGGWVDVPAEPNALVCNIGDMLDRMTAGRYRSTPHRVIASPGRSRLSFPYFFDPGWDVEVRPLPLGDGAGLADAEDRWDGTSLSALSGTYGEYLTGKVSRAFPELFQAVRGDPQGHGRL